MKRVFKYRNLCCTTIVLIFSVLSCEVQDDWFLEVPAFLNGSVLTGTSALTEQCKYALEGIYRVIDGSDIFGDTMVMKNTGDKISLFGYKNGSYFILDAGTKNSAVLFEGYWRHAFNDETGLAQFQLSDAGQIIAGDTTVASIIITGETGNGQTDPKKPVELDLISRFTSRLRHDPFIIGAHRAGGRTSDKLPVSENSVEMINYTNYFGSTGIEIDVRLTKDNVPVLYHDEDLNIRLIQKGPLLGKIGDYKYKQLLTMVRLIHGEKIPTLVEAFDAVLANPYINCMA
jgi:glycerophosphoryl diester phosphodiesterase